MKGGGDKEHKRKRRGRRERQEQQQQEQQYRRQQQEQQQQQQQQDLQQLLVQLGVNGQLQREKHYVGDVVSALHASLQSLPEMGSVHAVEYLDAQRNSIGRVEVG